MFWQLRKEKLKIFVWTEVISFGCFDETVQNSAGFCSIGHMENFQGKDVPQTVTKMLQKYYDFNIVKLRGRVLSRNVCKV